MLGASAFEAAHSRRWARELSTGVWVLVSICLELLTLSPAGRILLIPSSPASLSVPSSRRAPPTQAGALLCSYCPQASPRRSLGPRLSSLASVSASLASLAWAESWSP